MNTWGKLRRIVVRAESLLERSIDESPYLSRFFANSSARRLVVFLIQLVIVISAGFLSFGVRFDFTWERMRSLVEGYVLVSILVKIPVLQFFNLNRGWWRYSSLTDLVSIVKAVCVSQVTIALLELFDVIPFFPRSILFIDLCLVTLGLGGARMLFRIIHENGQDAAPKRRASDSRVAIVGAGDAGVALLQHLRRSARTNVNVIGFVDDNPFKQGMQFYTRPVLGKVIDLPQLKEAHGITDVYIAIPTLKKQELQRIADICVNAKLPFKKIPSVKEIIEMGSRIDELREVKVEDLLGREPIALDKTLTAAEIRGQTICITGAGGSIGSELCRQVLEFNPGCLLMLERSEYNLFTTSNELKARFKDIKIMPIVADVQDRVGLEKIFAEYSPSIVFHAAAHKHVPLMEDSPREAVRNNVFGTRNLADISCKYHVKRFVMISTDKAVNPLNVMGYSKRLAELVVQSRAGNGTEFISVRFGNVLGSSGSAVEIFTKQIKDGGPVTVTHADATRFFMTAPEAVELVLHAGTHGKSGEVYMLDMGQPVKITELAQKMIALADPEGKKDIKIKITGLRPGEKIAEEIVWEGEDFAPSSIEKVYRLKNKVRTAELPRLLTQLEDCVAGSNCDAGEMVKEVVRSIDRGAVAERLNEYAQPVSAAGHM